MLLAEGHQDARQYTIATVWNETRIVRQRHANAVKRDAISMQTVIASVLAEKGGELIKELLENLDDEY